METSAPSKMSAGLVWGVVLGVLSGLSWFALSLGLQMQGVADIIGWVASIGTLLGAQLGYRSKATSVSYGGAYLIAFFVSLFGGIVGAIASFVVLSFVPGLMDAVRTLMEQAVATSGGGGDPQATSMMLDFMGSPVALSVITGIGVLIRGLLLGLITSIFGRKKAAMV